MGKIEGGFFWGGNNKIFFVLFFRIVINVMYKRVKFFVLKNKILEEKVGLLYLNFFEYYLNNKKEFVIDDKDEKEMDILEYNKRGKYLFLFVIICIFD